MKCWNHKNRDAAGICSYCGMAVCRSCAVTTCDGRLACSAACRASINRERVPFLTVQRELAAMAMAQVWLLGVAAAAFMLLGALLLSIGLWEAAVYTFAAAAGFLIVGGIWWHKQRSADQIRCG